ncbi:Exostosin-1b isoform 1 [Schistosoma japonicum]|uniref:Exostosin-1b isoform 1 n=1 Tax=Schistosoma japonicum TaxID=6182 RepID=A0A4Z2CS56_SCHJA|nr:Exostosin-1b isoform 1 [Schistosoma japonicum]TNN07054.1 Exostosin-1b isoform 1 [Schistosoma japonicum]
MLAKASFSTKHFRPKFDISLPLIHSQHPLQSGSNQLYRLVSSEHLRGRLDLPYLLSFKGKRYVSGIGSASRDILFHLHNGKDIIMLTTCRHGTDWTRYADKRCAIDMALYDSYDYWELMYNSTFCLVPRGRRLGSYRFLEVLQAGCIPVMLSNDLELPFSEVIDWNRAVIWADERLPLLLPLILRRITSHQIIQYRQQVMFLWHTYLSSIESIVLTTLEILRDRVSLRRRSYEIWNTLPGGLVVSHVNSISSCDVTLHRYPIHCQSEIKSGFTMLIPIRAQLCSVYLQRLNSLGRILFHSVFLRKIIIIWECNNFPPNNNEIKPYASVPFEIVLPDERYAPEYPSNYISPSVRFQPFHEIPTLAVFAFSLNLNITVEQLNFGYLTWQEFPNRLVGFQARSHYWNTTDNLWEYNDKASLDYFSIILLNGAFYHRYYHYLYRTLLDRKLHEIVNVFNNCEDILFNCLISHVTSLPPVKLFATNLIEQKSMPFDRIPNLTALNTFREQRSLCIQAFSQHFVKFPYTGKHSNHSGQHTATSGNDIPELYLPLYMNSYSIYPSL